MKLKSLLDYNGADDRVPMTENQTMLMMSIMQMNMQGAPFPPKAEEVAKNDPICCIVNSRIELAGVQATVPVLMWMSIISEGNPGNAVMWAYTLCHIAGKRDLTTVGLDDVVHSFPWGFPTKDTLSKCWDAQKNSGPDLPSNSMDDANNWKIEVVPA